MKSRARAFEALVALLSLWIVGRVAAHVIDARRGSHPSLLRLPLHDPPEAATPVLRGRSITIPLEGAPSDARADPPGREGGREDFGAKANPIEEPSPYEADHSKSPNDSPPSPTRPGLQAGRPRASFWMLLRQDSGNRAEAPVGQLGGSQMGARVIVPLSLGKAEAALSLRASAAPDLQSGKELASGISFRPNTDLPLELIVEQRFLMDGKTSSKPAVILAGGLYDRPILGGLLAEGYAQTGAVGFHKPALFADGRFTLTTRRSHPLRAGIGVWGGVQPGLARLDLGPTLILPFRSARLTADWRIRLAGNARPASGPSLTFGKDF